MSSIDSRIVTMKFDNAAFQKGVQSTLDLLAKLKTATTGLPANAGKGLSSISSAVANTNIGGLSTQVDGVAHSFSALTTVATAALATIAVKATDAGLQFAKSFALGPITDGFSEYELTMGSIQTILSNTARYGTSLKEVTKNLNALNHYADKTIYNFGDMTKNIGLFTNAGIRIEDATSMIKGFSNEAAASGTNAQGAASAAYQLSQALSAGTIRLMDWRSLQNVGMGNKNMQNGLIEIADAMGELDKAGISATEVQDNFNGSLEKNWLSADVMSNYLKIMAGDMSKAKIEALGLSEAQTKQLLAQQKMSEDAATKVRTFTQLIGTIRESIGSGWSQTFKLLFGDFNQATKLFTGLNNSIGGWVNKVSNDRNRLLKQWQDLGGRDALIEGLKNGLIAIGHILKPIGQAFREVFPPATAQGLYELTVRFRDWTKGLVASKGTMNDIRDIFHAIFSIIKVGLSIVGGIIHYFASLFGLLSHGTGGVLDLVAAVARIISHFTDWINETKIIGKVFDHVIEGRAALLGPIIDKLSDLLSVVAKFIDLGADAAFDALTDAFKALQPYLPVVRDTLADIASMVQDKLVAAFEAVKPVVEDMGNAISGALGSVSGLGGSLGGSFSGIAGMFDFGDAPDKAASGVSKVNDALTEVGHTASDQAGPSLKGFWEFLKSIGGALLGFAKGVGNVASAIGHGIADAFSATGATAGGVFGAIGDFLGSIWDHITSFFSNISYGDIMLALNTGLMAAIGGGFARMMWQIGGVLKSFKGMFTQIGKGASEAMKSIGSGYESLGKAANNEARVKLVLAMAGSLVVLSGAVYLLGKVDPKKLGAGLGAVAAMMAALTASLLILEKNMPETSQLKGIVRLGALAALVTAMALAVLALSVAVKIFASMSLGELTKGLTSVALTLGILVGAAVALDKFGGDAALVRAAFAVGVLAVALTAFAGAVKLYSMLDTGMLAEGGAKVAAMLIGLGIALRFMPSTSILGSAAGLVLVAGALVIMAGALKVLASMSGGDTIQALIAMAGGLTALVIAANLMEGGLAGAAAMVVMAGAIAVLVPAILMLGNADLWTLVKGIGALLIAITALGALALAGTMVGATEALLLLGAAIALLGAGIFGIGAGMMLFASGLMALSATGSAAMVVLIDMINTFLEAIPGFLQRLGKSLDEAAKLVRTAGPAFIRAGGAILSSFLRVVIKNVPLIGKAFRTIIAEALKTLRAAIPDMIRTGFAILGGFLAGLLKNIGGITRTAVAIIVKFINGIAAGMDRIVRAGTNLAIKFIEAVGKELGNRAKDILEKAKGIGGNIVDGIREGFSSMWDSFTGWIQDQIDKIPWAVRKALHISSPSKVMAEIGRWIPLGLAQGVRKEGPAIDRATAEMSNTAIDTVKMTMTKLQDAVQLDPNMSPTITPVLDLTQMAKDASKIGTMLDGQTVFPSYSLEQANGIASDVEAAAQAAAEAASENGGDVYFEQHNHSPKALDNVTIYRQTRNQLSMAKKELSTP